MTRMLTIKSLFKMRTKILSLALVMMLGFLASCIPASTAPSVKDSSNTTNNTGTNNTAYPEPAYTTTGIFVQEGGSQSSTQFAVPLNFTDSFLLRGKSLSVYLRTLPNTTRFCLVGKYNFTSGSNKFLILSAKPKSFTDLVKKTTEFYLQVEPSNDAANQNDCLTYNLTTGLYNTVPSNVIPSASFSLTQLCATCNSAVTSEGLKLYFNNGEAVPTLNLSLLSLTVSGSNTTSGNTCVESSSCSARAYDCCLDGQCVNDGAVRPGAITQIGFTQAQLDVASNPNRFTVYPQYYFVCANRPEGNGEEDDQEPLDPAYEANIRLMELTHLYQCLNKVDGEISHCTLKFSSASQKINANSPFATEVGDINFQTLNPTFATGDYANNIVKIFYAGQYLYESNKTPLASVNGTFLSAGNDDVTNAQSVKITKSLPINALDDNLYLTFKVDGTCEKLGTSLARCTKSYTYNYSETKTESFTSSSKTFLLPSYIDLSSSETIVVKISGTIIPTGVSTWTKATGPNRIIFNSSYPLSTSQTITVTYVDKTNTAYHDSTKSFFLPSYADTSPSSNIILKISGLIVAEDSTTWSKAVAGAPSIWSEPNDKNRIVFNPGYSLYQNQNIEITYYVISGITDLLKTRTAAQAQVNNMCLCGTSGKCNLAPVLNSEQVVTNYECVHPSTTSNDPPANQTVYVSNKNIPHRYYDSNGVSYDDGYGNALDQEGTAFSYKNNDILRPTNIDLYSGYTGFNEIYGSFSRTTTAAARPAKMVKVKKDKVYDLFANSGVFSTCLTCGSDYYSSIKKIFPQSFNSIGGGYSPDNFSSQRVVTSGVYRSDDLLFGRACFVPATMIPWTHATATLVRDQRRNRLAAQHFLFANGYNRDWFGFDYGSLIASFDGVTWFSIGNQRRIKAASNKLFIAVNAYYGDLNLDSNFNVTVSETTAFSQALPDHDTESDGAECQRSHFCSNDNDCFRQIGYDYTCQNISGLTTNWPQSDANGNEVIGFGIKSIVSIVGGSNGQSKRCVYRGKGAGCQADLSSTLPTFNSSSLPGLLTCSSNSMCQPFSTGLTSRFNDRIARFANTPVAQNSYNYNSAGAPAKTDTIGLGARILGRPYEFYGTKAIPLSATTGLAGNNLSAVCIPGKNTYGAIKTYDLNSSPPAVRTDSSDKILGIGSTMSGNQSLKYLNSCPATDALGVSIQQYDLTLGDATTINVVTTAQNLSSNLLELAPIVAQNIFSSLNGSQITSVGYQRNTCLRAPGASCFSDMDCAPSEFIASKVKVANLAGILNTSEEKYWEEDLICGNPDFKYASTGILNTTAFNIKNNVCCRDYGKTFTVSTQEQASDHHWCDDTSGIKVAGVNLNISSFNRYSRVHTAYDKMTCNVSEVSTTKSFALSLKATSETVRYDQQPSQFKTLDTVNSRTCCTKNWIRNFAATNGGGHKWLQSKLQPIDKKNFISLNWNPNASGSDNMVPYQCEASYYMNPTCEMRDFTAADTELYLKFFGALELAGIPQVALMTEDHVSKINNGVDGGQVYTPEMPEETLQPSNSSYFISTKDFQDVTTSKKYFSASNIAALKSPLKKVFSEDEFSCCIPSGQPVPDYTTADQCCTGYLANSGANDVLRCCLQDFTDLTVYLSRYVSSEGRGLPDSAYDPNTGYIKDPGVVEMLAKQKGLCCSGEYARGVAIRKLPIPIEGNFWVPKEDAWTKRFVYLSTAVDNNTEFGPIGDLFDAGIRWNNHVYCIPKSLKIPDEK